MVRLDFNYTVPIAMIIIVSYDTNSSVQATGDTHTEAKRISSMLGIMAIASSAMPNEKLDVTKSIQAKGETVAAI